MTAIPPTAPPTIAPMGNEDLAAGAGVTVGVGVEVDEDEVLEVDVLLPPAELSTAVSTWLVVSGVSEAEVVIESGVCSMSSSAVCGTFAQAMTE